mmetsp:Transcript_18015/g.27906  ORF Transcript_18015/g.27906 Transcript_18015/m.27906 type:complete len:213 (+) Transcript_18015:1330-1968(+)
MCNYLPFWRRSGEERTLAFPGGTRDFGLCHHAHAGRCHQQHVQDPTLPIVLVIRFGTKGRSGQRQNPSIDKQCSFRHSTTFQVEHLSKSDHRICVRWIHSIKQREGPKPNVLLRLLAGIRVRCPPLQPLISASNLSLQLLVFQFQFFYLGLEFVDNLAVGYSGARGGFELLQCLGNFHQTRLIIPVLNLLLKSSIHFLFPLHLVLQIDHFLH